MARISTPLYWHWHIDRERSSSRLNLRADAIDARAPRDEIELPFAVAAGCHPLVLRCTQADWINIIVTKRAFWYKRLIELPAGRADAPNCKGSGGARGGQLT